MPGIIDYIKWRGDLSFDLSPFNEVDNLILSELSYIGFADLLDGQKESTLFEIADNYLDLIKDQELGVLLTGDFYLMLELMSKSKRYKDLIIKDCIELIDEEIEMQFSALTVETCKDSAYIAYRGTDDTLVGWKEDFKMSFLDVIPAQKKALEYLSMITSKLNYKKIYLGGHSKGGNLAVYAAVHADDEIKERIVKVYNNDGPGFKQKLLETQEYKDIGDKIETLIPQSSVVGMILEHEESYKVVKSNQVGVLQHDGFTWEVMGSKFVYLSNVADDSKMADLTLKKVLNTMDLQQREKFTNVLFEIISVNENRTLAEIKKDGLKSLYSMSKNFNSLDRKTKKALVQTVSMFFEEGFRSFLEVKNAEQWKLKLNTWHKNVPGKLNRYFHKSDHQ
jgi:hypothetical protein